MSIIRVTIFTKLDAFARFVALAAQKGNISDVLLYDLSCETNRSVHHHCGRSGCLVAFSNNEGFKFYLQPNRDVNTINSGPLECLCVTLYFKLVLLSAMIYFSFLMEAIVMRRSRVKEHLFSIQQRFIFHSRWKA